MVFNYKDILINLVLKNLRVKYKGSALGFLWFFLEPILTMLILSFVFSRVFKIQIENYPLFLLAAILPWTFFCRAVTEATTSIVDNANLVKNIYFPKEVLPISCVLSNFVCFLFGFLIFLPILIFFKVPINISIIFLPPVLFFHLLFTIGLSLITSCINVYLRDINHFVKYILMVWFYVTPILYPLSMVPAELHIIYILNPMTPIVVLYRNVLFEGKLPLFLDIRTAFVSAIISMLIGYIVFRKFRFSFAKEV